MCARCLVVWCGVWAELDLPHVVAEALLCWSLWPCMPHAMRSGRTPATRLSARARPLEGRPESSRCGVDGGRRGEGGRDNDRTCAHHSYTIVDILSLCARSSSLRRVQSHHAWRSSRLPRPHPSLGRRGVFRAGPAEAIRVSPRARDLQTRSPFCRLCQHGLTFPDQHAQACATRARFPEQWAQAVADVSDATARWHGAPPPWSVLPLVPCAGGDGTRLGRRCQLSSVAALREVGLGIVLKWSTYLLYGSNKVAHI